MKILGVRFEDVGKISYYYSKSDNISKFDKVIAETKLGVECGTVLVVKEYNKSDVSGSHDFIIRKITDKDLKVLDEKKVKEAKALEICKEKVVKHKLPMKLISALYTFDYSKLLFYFSSDSRVDFRNLVKDLAYNFRVRIELRQVSSRDETRLFGGIGVCGRILCCSTFPCDFGSSVSIKMAKNQGLTLNPVKLAGNCGRLMCCLKYEENVYHENANILPEVGSYIKTIKGEGTVIARNLLQGTVEIELSDDSLIDGDKVEVCAEDIISS